MKLVRNKTHKPIQVPLSGGGVLHLGPAKTGEVSDATLERPAFRKLVDSGDLEVVGEGRGAGAATDDAGTVHESTHGHPPAKVVLPKGNR